tara:strand:- start:659 stop:1855 length:1197 start_codon:yes stop_codon:yes gene_type:complete
MPNINIKINSNNLKIAFNLKKEISENKHISISHNTHKYVNVMKCQIDAHSQEWDEVKKYTNPYEFINTVIPYSKTCISKYKPISRAFFKLVEIYNIFNILKNQNSIQTFHLAEGPGGFIEATAFLRKNKRDKYYGITLIRDDSNIPGWKKCERIMREYPNITIERGVDNTGNLYNYKNYLHCVNNYSNSMNIITADGGFDFSKDFQEQETSATRLILTQIFYAISLQKFNGSFILKVFDIFTNVTVEMVYLLSCFYKHVFISKPNTSRQANSEKYIVCKFFKYVNTSALFEKVINILKVLDEKIDLNTYYIKSILNLDIQHVYTNKIEEINTIFGQQQIENIRNTISQIINKNYNKLETLKKHNINKCINWCEKNNIKYNSNPMNSNVFRNKKQSGNY